jgi:hypothetical protein
MKKLFGLLVVAASFAGGLTLQSCEKCSDCIETWTYDGHDFSYDYPEECGTKMDIDAYEQECRDAAARVGGTCSCVSK